MRYLVIGAGVAGLAAMEAIRSLDRDGELVLVGDDPHGFYSRPGLAYLLTGELHDKALFPRTAADYKRLNFRYVRGRVTGIRRDISSLELDSLNGLLYDRLLIAVGAQALPLDVPGASLEGVLKLDNLEDARRILKLAHRGRTAIVIGGGITALELVEGLRARGMKVHYLLRGDRYWSNVLDAQESRIVEARLHEEGVSLHYHAGLAEVTGRKGRVHAVRLSSGQTLKCDLLAYAIGIRPRTELAKQSGLAVDRGILVDEYLQTNDENIFAAGDVAQVHDPLSGRSVLDSLWNPARQQGYTAGLNMAGKRTPYTRAASFNVTRLAGLTTTIIGAVGGGRDDDLVGIARGDSETWRELPDAALAQSGFEVNRVRVMVGGNTVLGAIVMGDQKLSLPLERIISDKVDISPIRERLLAPDAKVADLIAEFWMNWKSNKQQSTA
ncbi:MAG: NAD(P)/FAD-dependent oxidoreductase [Bacteroidota bacterium]